MHMKQPSQKTLLIAWLAMMVFSIGTMFTGRVTDQSALGPLFVLSLFAITWLKATWVLRYFLNLRAASSAWNQAFLFYLLLLLSIIFGTYMYSWANG